MTSQAAIARQLGISAPALTKRIQRLGYDAAIAMPKSDPHASRPRRTQAAARAAAAADYAARRIGAGPEYREAYEKRLSYVAAGMWPERAIGRDPAINAAEVAEAMCHC